MLMFAHRYESKLSRPVVGSIIIVFSLALIAAISTPLAFANNAAIVTKNGPVKGISIFGVEGYLGIPYAVPPVGNLRWMPPVPSGKFPGGVFQESVR